MKTFFLCLANSKKYQERCIAGIELRKEENHFLPIFHKDDTPKWIRPVSKTNYGAIDANLVQNVALGDIIEIDNVEECPHHYQSENVLFSSLSVLRKSNLSIGALDKCTDKRNELFGNDRKSVSIAEIADISYSLTLIRVSEPVVYSIMNYKNNIQFRMKFVYNLIEYDLPITDVNFIEKFIESNQILKNAKAIYLTISLAVIFENEHYKLVAGIIYL